MAVRVLSGEGFWRSDAREWDRGALLVIAAGLFPGVIGRAGQRAGLYMFEPHLESNVAPAIEFLRSDIAFDR